jgi:hypothetical protein
VATLEGRSLQVAGAVLGLGADPRASAASASAASAEQGQRFDPRRCRLAGVVG